MRKPVYAICEQQRRRSACGSMQFFYVFIFLFLLFFCSFFSFFDKKTESKGIHMLLDKMLSLKMRGL